jgi:hypothetical protein
VDFSNTTGAVVECSARGNPVPEIIWVRSDGTAVGDVPGLRQVQNELQVLKSMVYIRVLKDYAMWDSFLLENVFRMNC